MAQRYVVEHKMLCEQPVDRLWTATWKYSVLVLYYSFLGFSGGAVAMVAYMALTK